MTRASEKRPPNPVSARFGRWSPDDRLLDPYARGRHVHPLDVLVEHSDRREPPDRARDRAAHLGGPALRHVVLVAAVVERHDFLLEQAIQVLRVGMVLGALVRVGFAATDGPTVIAQPAFVPPAVEDGQVDEGWLGD